MSSSSRVMASNYLNAKIYYKNLYYQIKPTESICSVCSNRSHSIRMDTCCYSCLEKKLKSRNKTKNRNRKRFKFTIFKRLFRFGR